ncbi:TIGR02594 family protein [Hydrogenophaga sp.]|uniref:TIGR02594 family protein n=1 Tax=Hydrogenophaga sp. TaxID=1904254 RepID=UPI0025C18DB0|nr:TIGR02594 family protein [Hydrogenophaga sp.]MBT9465524.1 TIGR02594 family protein [Hydrogenophaga sp.]
MATEQPRADGDLRNSSKGLIVAIASVVAALALFIGNVDKIWTVLSGWVSGKNEPLPPAIIIQISAQTLVDAAAEASAVASAASGSVSVEAAREAANLKTAAENLKAPIALGSSLNPIPPWLAITFREIGQKEIEGSQHNPRILEYIASVDPSAVSHGDELPWSTYFVNWALTQAGKTGTRSGAGRTFLQWGMELQVPKPGAIALFGRSGRSTATHACLYVGDAGDQILCLSGNVSNSVQISAMPKAGLLGYRWPKDA